MKDRSEVILTLTLLSESSSLKLYLIFVDAALRPLCLSGAAARGGAASNMPSLLSSEASESVKSRFLKVIFVCFMPSFFGDFFAAGALLVAGMVAGAATSPSSVSSLGK